PNSFSIPTQNEHTTGVDSTNLNRGGSSIVQFPLRILRQGTSQNRRSTGCPILGDIINPVVLPVRRVLVVDENPLVIPASGVIEIHAGSLAINDENPIGRQGKNVGVPCASEFNCRGNRAGIMRGQPGLTCLKRPVVDSIERVDRIIDRESPNI